MRKELGSSNKIFYYTLVDRGTFNMQVMMRLRRKLNPEKLRQAISRTMPRFPEFAIAPDFQNGHLFAEDNQREVVLRKEDGEIHSFASEDTNGYLFYFSYDDVNLKFSCFHGLADFKGYMVLLRTVLYEYGLATDTVFSEEDLYRQKGSIRFSAEDLPADKMDAWDPYVKYTENVKISEEGSAPEGAAAIHSVQYSEESSELNCFEITCSASAYREKAKTLESSAASLLAAVVSTATFQWMEVDKSKPVVAMLPVDLRPVFGSQTVVNFSDGILLPMSYEDLSLPLKERSRKIYAAMKNQICRETFEPVMLSKVGQVKAMEENSGDIREIIDRNVTLPPPGSFCPFTYALTYPGSLSMGAGLDSLLDDVSVQGFARASSVIASSFGDTMRIRITYRSDDPTWPNAIRKELCALGIDAEMKALGRRQGDILVSESFLNQKANDEEFPVNTNKE